MKKLFLGLLVAAFTLTTYSCRETEENTEAEFEEVESDFEEAGDEIEGEFEEEGTEEEGIEGEGAIE